MAPDARHLRSPHTGTQRRLQPRPQASPVASGAGTLTDALLALASGEQQACCLAPAPPLLLNKSSDAGAEAARDYRREAEAAAGSQPGHPQGAAPWTRAAGKRPFVDRPASWLLDLGTGGITTLTPGPRDYDPSWSADGSLIAFSSGTAPAEIDVMDSAGSGRHTLLTGALQPDWAPSGTTLALTRSAGFGSHIAVTDGITGAHTHDLTSGATDDSYSPAWSPNGKQIAFGRGQDMENPGVWVMSANGSHQNRLFGRFDPAW